MLPVTFFKTYFRPKEESVFNFFQRYFSRMCDSLVSPSRFKYNAQDLNLVCKNCLLFEKLEFQVYSNGITLQACLWKRKSTSVAKQICIVYMHTNTRSIIDANEIFSAAELYENVSIAAFDLPGCGKSEGCLSGTVYKDLKLLLEWIQCLISADVQIILWARGMSTAAAIEFLASSDKISSGAKSTSSSKEPLSSTLSSVKAVVLDSPFKSISEMISDAVEKLHGRGYSVSKAVMDVCSRMVVRTLTQRLGGFNPLQVVPIDWVRKCRVPAFVMSASQDDYISPSHGQAIAAAWGGPVSFRTFSGSHFGIRPEEIVVEALHFVAAFINASAIIPPNMSTTNNEKNICLEASIQSDSCDRAKSPLNFFDIDELEATEPPAIIEFQAADLEYLKQNKILGSGQHLNSGIGFYFHSLSRTSSIAGFGSSGDMLQEKSKSDS